MAAWCSIHNGQDKLDRRNADNLLLIGHTSCGNAGYVRNVLRFEKPGWEKGGGKFEL